MTPADEGRSTDLWTGYALDALVGLAATAYAAVVLLSVPAFLQIKSNTWGSGLALGCGALLAYAQVGPHAASRRWRQRVPLGALGLIVAWTIVAVTWHGWMAGMFRPLLVGAGQITSWIAGRAPDLGPPGAWPVLFMTGILVGIPVFTEARRGQPAIAIAIGFVLFALEWAFVDTTAQVFFWPLVIVALLWFSADRARRLARATHDRTAVTRPWLVLGATLAVSLVVALVIGVSPRHLPPANLGALANWFNDLPVVRSLEQGTRGGGHHADTGQNSSTASTAGFSLASTGFSPSITELGGPTHPYATPVFNLTVSARGPLPTTLYLRGAVLDDYTGRGWTTTPEEESPDPMWPEEQAGSLVTDFLEGNTLPAPYQTIQMKVVFRQPSSTNLFTVLSPLSLSLPVQWDQAGEAWTAASIPAGSGYHLTAAVLGSASYTSTSVARYTNPEGSILSPLQALLASLSGQTVHALPTPYLATGPLPLASDLALPPSLPSQVTALAEQWTAAAPTPLLKALAIEEHLLAYPYTLDAPAPPPGTDFVSFFLFQARDGYCTYYSTAMAVLLRTIGIPSRWVEGYRVPIPPGGGTFVVTDAQAHAWVEAYIPPYGWVTFDPTPSSATPPPAVAVASTVTFHAGQALIRPLQALRRLRWQWSLTLPAAAACILVLLACSNAWKEAHPPSDPELAAVALWQISERVTRRFGRAREPGETPLEYAGAVALCYPSLRASAVALAEAFGQVRYSNDPLRRQHALGRMRQNWVEMQAVWLQVRPLSYLWRRWL